MSYAAGLFKMLGFYYSFNAEWLFELMDIQGFISEGLPVVMPMLAAMVFHFFALNGIAHRKNKFIFFVLVIFISSGSAFLLVLYRPAEYSVYTAGSAAVGLGGSGFVAWIIHRHIHSGSKPNTLYHLTAALSCMLIVGPLLAGQGRAHDIRYAREKATEVVDGNNRVVGMLVRYMGGKYLVLDCRVDGQLSFYDCSPLLRLRQSSGQCKAVI